MFANRELLKQIDILPAFPGPVMDIAGGAVTGEWVPLRNYARVALLFLADVGTAAEDPILTFQQATSAAGAGAKNFAQVTKFLQKEHVTALPSTWSEVTQAAAATVTSATGGESKQMQLIEIDPALMDVAGGFDFINVSSTDLTTAGKLGTAVWLCLRPRYASDYPAASA